MCYARPGPRCSHHAEMAYSRAQTRWEEVSRSGSDIEKLTAMEALQKAIQDYDMTPAGQRDLKSRISILGDKDGSLTLRLERGQNLRAVALAEIKMKDVGDYARHSLLENIEANIPNSEGFPREEIIACIRDHVDKYGQPIGSGRNRVVFKRDDGTVVKIPKNWDGEMDNAREANWDSSDVPLATCHLESTKEGDQGMSLLVMEEVTPVAGMPNLPDWVDWVDCQQVGYTADGRLVAYDL